MKDLINIKIYSKLFAETQENYEPKNYQNPNRKVWPKSLSNEYER